MKKILLTDKFAMESILDAFLQESKTKVYKETFHDEPYGIVKSRLTIEWVEEDE